METSDRSTRPPNLCSRRSRERSQGSQHQLSLEGVSRRLAAGSFCCAFVFPINITMISMTMGERRYLRLAIVDDQKRAHLQDPIDRQARHQSILLRSFCCLQAPLVCLFCFMHFLLRAACNNRSSMVHGPRAAPCTNRARCASAWTVGDCIKKSRTTECS